MRSRLKDSVSGSRSFREAFRSRATERGKTPLSLTRGCSPLLKGVIDAQESQD